MFEGEVNKVKVHSYCMEKLFSVYAINLRLSLYSRPEFETVNKQQPAS